MQNSGMNAQNGVDCGKALHDAAFMLNLRQSSQSTINRPERRDAESK
jgi:hypothetical protein